MIYNVIKNVEWLYSEKSKIVLSYIKVLPFFVYTPPITSVSAVYCGNFLDPVIVTVQNLGRVGIEL